MELERASEEKQAQLERQLAAARQSHREAQDECDRLGNVNMHLLTSLDTEKVSGVCYIPAHI